MGLPSPTGIEDRSVEENPVVINIGPHDSGSHVLCVRVSGVDRFSHRHIVASDDRSQNHRPVRYRDIMECDVLIIGGGIAGLSAGAWLTEDADVVLVEAEEFLGYHTTGRSAALYTECYGDGPIRRLTLASRDYLTSHDGLTSPRPVLFVGDSNDSDRLEALYREFSDLAPSITLVSPERVCELCPAIRMENTAGGVYEPDAMEIDVDALQTMYAKRMRSNGGRILTGSLVRSIVREGSRWTVIAGDIEVNARIIVNASGAWGDAVAEMAGVTPLGLRPFLRSVFTTAVAMPTDDWPFVIGANEDWYFKPEGPNLLGSAASEILSVPTDAKAPEIDIALGIERINDRSNLAIRSVTSTWAGLRTFTQDRNPAVGFDPAHRGFFWLVGQGGYGIMTSPAVGELSASLILSSTLSERTESFGITIGSLAPERFRR